MMPPVENGYPTRDHVDDYLARYEDRYQLAVQRPLRVNSVERIPGALRVRTEHEHWDARAVVSATGTWSHPHIPLYPGSEIYGASRVALGPLCRGAAVRR